jgi:YVTN family beta-propeller protein
MTVTARGPISIFTLVLLALSFGAIPAQTQPIVYVADGAYPEGVAIVDTATNAVVDTIPLPDESTPGDIAITPDGRFLYVLTSGYSTVSVINTEINSVVTTVAVGAYPIDIAITPDGLYAYVTNHDSGDVSVISTQSNSVRSAFPGMIVEREERHHRYSRFCHVVSGAGGRATAIAKMAHMLPPRRGVSHGHFSGHRRYPQLKARQKLRFLWSIPEQVTNQEQASALFKPTRRFTRDDGNLLYLFRLLKLSDLPQGPQRLSDAVAVAGRMVYRLGHPRLVVLIISEDPVDASSLSPATVRRYLASLGVPLVVWSPAHERIRGSPWGEVEWIETTTKLRRALNRVSNRLDEQRIVWLEGLHLPQQITLSPAVQNLRMAR